MATQLPIRIEFRLPDGWNSAPPDDVGAPGAAFVAVYGTPSEGFTPNITISGELRPDAATLDDIADESIARLRESVDSVRLRKRAEAGTADAPGLTQALDLDAMVQGERRSLVQVQVFLSVQDQQDASKRAVLDLIMTCALEQLDDVLGDFQEFVRTVRPDQD